MLVIEAKKVLNLLSPHSSGLGARTGNTEGTAIIQSQDLAKIISDNTKDNFARMQRLLYYSGGEARYGKNPEHLLEISAFKWIEDLKAKNRLNWTDEGRIELAK